MISLLLKATGIWFILMLLAMGNAVFREKVLQGSLGLKAALPLSGLLLSIIILIVAFVSVSFLASSKESTYIAVGIFWFSLTLGFEFLFGRFAAGKDWREILQVFNLKQGDLFILALLFTLLAPWLSAKLQGLI